MPNTSNAPLVSVVIPVKDEDPLVVQTLIATIHAEPGMEALVIDDGSQVPVVNASYRFPISRGYGAAIKQGIRLAKGALIATMDGDGQHRVWDVQRLQEFFLYFCNWYDGIHHHTLDMVIGDRRLKEHGHRLWGRKALNWTATLFTHQWIADLNSGMRIFRKEIALGYEPILSNGFSFTTSLTLAMMADGYVVDWLPIQVFNRKQGISKVHIWRDGWQTLKLIVWIGGALRTRKLRRG